MDYNLYVNELLNTRSAQQLVAVWDRVAVVWRDFNRMKRQFVVSTMVAKYRELMSNGPLGDSALFIRECYAAFTQDESRVSKDFFTQDERGVIRYVEFLVIYNHFHSTMDVNSLARIEVRIPPVDSGNSVLSFHEDPGLQRGIVNLATDDVIVRMVVRAEKEEDNTILITDAPLLYDTRDYAMYAGAVTFPLYVPKPDSTDFCAVFYDQKDVISFVKSTPSQAVLAERWVLAALCWNDIDRAGRITLLQTLETNTNLTQGTLRDTMFLNLTLVVNRVRQGRSLLFCNSDTASELLCKSFKLLEEQCLVNVLRDVLEM